MGTGEKRIYNADLLEAIHKIDKRLEVHIAWCTTYFKRIEDVEKEVNGMSHQHETLWDERVEKRGLSKEVKIAIIIGILNSAGIGAKLLNIF